MHFLQCTWRIFDQVPDHNITNRETDRRKIHLTVGKRGHECVVATATSYRAFLLLSIKNLENYSSVVGQSTHDGKVYRYIVPHTSSLKVIEHHLEILAERRGRINGLSDLLEWKSKLF